MNNVFAALWHRDSIIYRRQFFTIGVMPILTGLIFFFMFYLPYQGLLSAAEMAKLTPSLVLDSILLTLLITIYESTARFYWAARNSNRMASIYEMGRFHRQPSFFIAQSVISLLKGFMHLLIVLAILIFLTGMSLSNINFQATIVFLLLGALQIVALSKIIGLFVKHLDSLSKFLYIGLLPMMMISGLFLLKGGPMEKIPEIAFYLPPYNWMAGLDKAFLNGNIDYGFLLIGLIETLFLIWVSASFFHLDGDS
jgi:hypothetical protein